MDGRSGDSRSDAALLERFRRGDKAVFDAIVREHRETVYAVARRLLGNHADADEAAQEAFVKAWRSRARFRGESAVRTWLISIVLNVGRSMLAARPPSTAMEDTGNAAHHGPGPYAEASRGEAAARVRRAVASLPPRQREVVVLKVFSEMTYEDVARTMSLSVGAVKAHLHQAVANLRKRMAAEGGRA